MINRWPRSASRRSGGYSSFYPEGAGRFLSYIQYGEDSLRGRCASTGGWLRNRPRAPLLNLANARYLLTAPRVAI